MLTTDEIKREYDRDYRDRKFGGPDYTHKWIPKLLCPDKGKRLLDIGCSQGYLMAEAGKLGLLTFGIDISQGATNCFNTPRNLASSKTS